MSSSSADLARHRSASLLSPTIDLLSVGGLSVIVFVPLLLSGRSDLLLIGAGAQAWVATLVNMPHFMASYRMVYRNRETILRHRTASLYVPALLLVAVLAAVVEAQYSPVGVIILVSMASAYLAWHYTGQVWGMMASYAYLDGTGFDTSERSLIRTSLRILLAWHVTWFLYTQLRNPSVVRPAYLLISGGTAVALGLGGAGLWKMRRRTGKLPPARALVAWIAIFVWYAVMARDPKAIFWIQIAHALQYLAFPIRVEINRSSVSAGRSHVRFVCHMALYGAGLLIASYLVAQVVPGTAMSAIANVFGEQPGRVAPILILMFINIHHYFTDGVIWHISDPEVRNQLFAHVRAKSFTRPVAQGGAGAASAAPRREKRKPR